MKNHSSTLKALVILIILGVIWGSGYTLAKYALSNGVPPLGYAFWQALGPALLLTPFTFLTKHNPLFKPIYWPYFLICGFIGIVIPNTNMYFIAEYIPAGLLAVLVNTVPLMLYPIALATGQERFDAWRMLALLFGLSGMSLILIPNAETLFSSWMLLALLSPLSFALCSMFISSKQPTKLNALQAASGMLLSASLLLTPFVIAEHSFYPLWPLDTQATQVVILEIALSSIGYLLFFQLVRLAGPVFYSLTGSMVAITGLCWGFIVFDEKPKPIQGLAILFVISALFLLSWRQSKQPSARNLANANRHRAAI